jgi:acyl-CoA thioester hydrolase
MRDMQTSTARIMSNEGFVWPIRIYYEDTDAAGIVFYANYLKFFERARTEWLCHAGIDQRRLTAATGTVFVVRTTSVDYLAPARLGDELKIFSRIERFGRASVDFEQRAFREETVIATGTIRVVCVTLADMRPAPVSPEVLTALGANPVSTPDPYASLRASV